MNTHTINSQPIDTLYFGATYRLDPKLEKAEENQALIDQAEENFSRVLAKFVCISLPGDPVDSFRCIRKEHKTQAETLAAAKAYSESRGPSVTVLNLTPFEQAFARYCRFI